MGVSGIFRLLMKGCCNTTAKPDVAIPLILAGGKTAQTLLVHAKTCRTVVSRTTFAGERDRVVRASDATHPMA